MALYMTFWIHWMPKYQNRRKGDQIHTEIVHDWWRSMRRRLTTLQFLYFFRHFSSTTVTSVWLLPRHSRKYDNVLSWITTIFVINHSACWPLHALLETWHTRNALSPRGARISCYIWFLLAHASNVPAAACGKRWELKLKVIFCALIRSIRIGGRRMRDSLHQTEGWREVGERKMERAKWDSDHNIGNFSIFLPLLRSGVCECAVRVPKKTQRKTLLFLLIFHVVVWRRTLVFINV